MYTGFAVANLDRESCYFWQLVVENPPLIQLNEFAFALNLHLH